MQLSDFYCTKKAGEGLKGTLAYSLLEQMGHAAEVGIMLAYSCRRFHKS
jgi:hypothetical protein